MPNWCNNRVDFYSDDTDKIAELREIFTGDDVFRKIVPPPNWQKTPLAEKDVKEYSFSKPRGEVGELPVVKDKGFGKGLYFPSTDNNDDRWYDWNIQNWGTKWDVDGKYSNIEDYDEYSFQVEFETAWSPPEQIYYALREKYGETVDITWFYDEPGAQVAGYLGS